MTVAKGDRVRLRRITLSDLKRAAPFQYTLFITEPGTELARLQEVHAQTGFWTEHAGAVAIVALEDDRVVGTMQFYRSGPGIHGYEIGYILHDEDDRGKGYASEGLRLFSDLLFEERPGCHRLQLIIETWNDASARLAEACGYASEGTLRKAGYSAPDEPSDCFIYSRVR
jgi:RimJ/RimL family protein N-acetyltransferase